MKKQVQEQEPTKAKYHPEPGREVEFDILKFNPNGTVNLGIKNGDDDITVVVTSCRVTESIEIGACRLVK